MRLTKVQRQAVKFDDNTLIVACPGSGKTRTLAAKLIHCLDEVRDSSRKIVCLTYTNAAVYEIEDRLRMYGKCGDEDYCDISTIHSFCLVNILNSFYELIPEYSKGFSVVTPDNEEYQTIADDVLGEFDLDPKFRDDFESFNREPDGTPILPEDFPAKLGLEFWERLRRKKLIDFPNIVYYAYKLINERPSIGHALSCKYAWFLVDEFQDTTALQVEIFRKLSQFGHSKFFLVGDPYQSIYGFAGARVELMEKFAEEIGATTEFKLGNFRSTNLIIEHAEKLCPRIPKMKGVGDTAEEKVEPIYVHTSSAFEAITDFFLPIIEDLGIAYGDAAILAPWWVKLVQLGRKLRDYGIPIVGPGARPYKRSHIFASVAEQVCAYISFPEQKTFHQIGRELFLLVEGVLKRRSYRIYSYDGSKTIWKLIDSGRKGYKINPRAVDWLRRSAEEFGVILCQDGLLREEDREVLRESAKSIIEDIVKNKIDIDNLSVEDLGLFASTGRNLHLLTMHRAKGREFDAVAIIDCHEGRVPDFRAIKKKDRKRIDEDKRLLYVSITRARRFLLYVTDEERYTNEPSRFLCEGCLDLKRYN
jgi:DNA helicase-2/ATP-dependent DNA helicase PcrA